MFNTLKSSSLRTGLNVIESRQGLLQRKGDGKLARRACSFCRDKKVNGMLPTPCLFTDPFTMADTTSDLQLKCTEERPQCSRCVSRGIPCHYSGPKATYKTETSSQGPTESLCFLSNDTAQRPSSVCENERSDASGSSNYDFEIFSPQTAHDLSSQNVESDGKAPKNQELYNPFDSIMLASPTSRVDRSHDWQSPGNRKCTPYIATSPWCMNIADVDARNGFIAARVNFRYFRDC